MATLAFNTLLNRSHLFRRAHQLARLNRQPSRPTPFDFWLRQAWTELKAGQSSAWCFAEPTALDRARDRVQWLETRDYLGVAGMAQLGAAYADLRHLAA